MRQRAPVQSLHTATVESLARWIVGGRYGSGALLPNEAEIGDELEVSRTVVREAVRTLVAKGMLATRRRLGTEVIAAANWSQFDRDVLAWRLRFNPTADLVRDLYEFRMTAEVHAAGCCAASPSFDRRELMARLARLEAAALRSTDDWATADIAFHQHILLGTNNALFLYIEPILDQVLRLMIARNKIDPASIRRAVPLHRRVAEEIERGDGPAARLAMEQIVHRGQHELGELLEDWRERVSEQPAHAAPVRAAAPVVRLY